MRWFLAILLAAVSPPSFASEATVENFIFVGSIEPSLLNPLLSNKFAGVQAVYSWKRLEPAKDVYDFAKVEEDLKFLEGKGKKLWIQLQDRFFNIDDKHVPPYLLTERIYQGGLAKQSDNPGEGQAVGHGWVTKAMGSASS